MTLDRLMRRLSEGEAIDRVESYAYGIARLVLLETARRERLLVHSANMDDVLADTEDAQSRIEGFGADEAESAKVDDELRMDALEACLEQLSPAERSLVLAYYAGGDGADRIEQRKVLSQRLGVAEHIVRARVFRVRARLERCMRCRERGDTSRCKQQTTDRGEPS
jgi:RNA polymerase sigma factor (sigma-70 family)